MKKRLQDIFLIITNNRIHFIVWFLFIFYEVVLTGIVRGTFASAGNYAVFYFLNICLFYFHAYVVMPAAKTRTSNAIWLLPLLIFIEIVLYVPFTIYIVSFLQKYAYLTINTPAVINKTSVASGVWRSSYFILFSSGYYYLMNYIKERKATQEAEKTRLLMIIEHQNVQAELIKSQHAHLKAQINPHFLFNTLSFIYSNTRKVVPEAADAIMALSEMMRYAIQDDTDRNFTALTQEIEQIENLIRLHQIKSENGLHIFLNYDDNLNEIQIIPLILITLVENIFKHGDLLHEEHPARISISCDGQTLIVETENLINMKTTGISHHIGLENIKKRLRLVYDNMASLQTEKDFRNYFNVMLRIELN
ncbi:MAG: histidine kinase [Candidatus Pedobacter colombiensis]|uniref:Histidine kinase n=1 Tax=Candidatus Pedobacter colombiensis TaxID=3121371 RepID=A0AAJ5WBI8_9SPHI|nr:histidine kinase [Pedobacter sp.]WEK21532.1 MAG: histidine kinase [Pedobacter sp.]